MDKRGPASFQWSVQASALQRRFLTIVHLVALMALWVSAIEPFYKALLVLVIIISGWCYGRRYGRSHGAVAIRYTDAFGWELSDNNDCQPIRILKSTVVMPWVIVLHYRVKNQTRHWAIFSDALSREGFIQLTVQLKIAGLAEP